MAEAQDVLRQVFGTRNRSTSPVPGTSRAGMEAAVSASSSPASGSSLSRTAASAFSSRTSPGGRAPTSRWCGPLGRAGGPRRRGAKPPRRAGAAVLIVHAETSTGVMNPVREVAAAAHRHGVLVIVDAVCSFAGAPLETDAWELDVVVAGTQKCLGCPSGLAPVTYSDAVAARMARRRTPIRSNYLDLTQLDRYWGPERLNHHTAPTTMVYGLREALRIVVEEGPTPRIARHRGAATAMAAGLAALGLELFGEPPGPGKMPMLAPAPRSGWSGRRGVPVATARGARGRDHGRVRPPRRADLADRNLGGNARPGACLADPGRPRGHARGTGPRGARRRARRRRTTLRRARPRRRLA